MDVVRRRFGFWLTSIGILVFSAAVASPSPVYPLYQSAWHLSPVAMTAMFAIYVAGLLGGLLTAGSLSDFVGRRAVILPAIVICFVALLLLGSAGGLGAVLVARVVQGLAMSLVVGSLGASLLDFAPPGNPRLAATFNGALWPLGLAVGALLGGLLVDDAPAPTHLVYYVLAAVVVLLFVAMWFLPASAARRPGALTSLAPSVSLPPRVRGVFFAVLGCLLAAWALGGLYLGIGASIVRSLFGLHAAVDGALAMAAVTGIGAVTGIATQHRDARRVMLIGAATLIIGPVLTIVSVHAHESWLFYVSSVVSGVGFGAGFQGGLRLILAEADENGRAGVLSAVYVACYGAFSVPALIAGLLTPRLGLSKVVTGYSILVVLMAAVAVVLQLSRRSVREAELVADDDEREHQLA